MAGCMQGVEKAVIRVVQTERQQVSLLLDPVKPRLW